MTPSGKLPDHEELAEGEVIGLNDALVIRRQQELANVNQLTDRLGCAVDDDIKQTVVTLRLLGFNTAASCEGHLDHGLPGPWVDIEPSPGSYSAALVGVMGAWPVGRPPGVSA